jgi:NADH-quinone oxidoreductase subunit L
MNREKLKTAFVLLVQVFLGLSLTYAIIFLCWAVDKTLGLNIEIWKDWDRVFYQSGKYSENWFTRYLITFNIPYIIYIISGCFGEFCAYYYYTWKTFFFFDQNYPLYRHHFGLLLARWHHIQYSTTYWFYVDLNTKLNQTIFNNNWSFRQNFTIICPHYWLKDSRIASFISSLDNLNNLMILGSVLFVLSTIISLFMMSYLGLYGVFILNLITIILFWAFTLGRIKYFFLEGGHFKIYLGKWFSLFGHMIIPFELYIDSISYSYILLTLTIAVFVYIYVFSYFRYEPNVERLLLFISLFVISMLLLVSSGNFFVLFLGWELIGLTSFFLINFWSTRIGTLKAAFKAYVFNKFSDVSLFIGFLLSILLINDTNIQVFNSQIHIYQNYVLHIGNSEISYLEIVSFFILTAAFIKSAQFGTHIWLPDSMEAPAPASALIHSATLVSAGVFLVLRFTPLFELTRYSYYMLAIIGSFTAFFGGCCAMYQSDIKRILAYSTISHCGFLMVTCITRIPELTVFYLYVHGFFKAAVFLCVGNIIRFSNNYQDFKKMGGFWKYMPFECICSLICLMNLSGMPFTLGFYIKHILVTFLNREFAVFYVMLGFVIAGALTGLIYSFRLYYYVFFDFKKGKKYLYVHSNRKTFKSLFYSNTSLASNIAISGLIVVGYLISIYLYIIIFSKFSISEAFDNVTSKGSSFYNLHWPLVHFLTFVGGLNWFILQIIIILIFSTWRYVHNFHNVVSSLFSFILFSIFFYLNLTITSV